MRLETKYTERYIDKSQLDSIKEEIKKAHIKLEKGTGKGAEFLGWLHLPSATSKKELSEIKNVATLIRSSSDIFIVIGIGGSYLGSRAAIEFLGPSYRNRKTTIYFVGNNIDPVYIKNIIATIRDRKVSINIISKSGTTTEPAITFRIFKDYMSKRYRRSELKKRIICTTTEAKGTLFSLAKEEGYRLFYIPEDVGGRFSVLTAVGLLPMAVYGIDIASLIRGASDCEEVSSSCNIFKNPSYRYAALRNLLYRNGKKIEIMASFHTRLFYLLEWWKQLFAESEGKEQKGIFPATAVFSTDLHSIGQLIQEGERNIFETFLNIENTGCDINIPSSRANIDNLNYLSGKGLDFVNRMAYEATALAHLEGGIPNMTISIKEATAYCLGELLYFFERAVGISGYLMSINPFDQPGVEAYKKNMLRLLAKPC